MGYKKVTLGIRAKSKKRAKIAPSTKKEITQIVKKQINKREETKVYSSSNAISSSLASGTIYNLSPTQQIVQGTGINQRIGNEIFLKNITITLVMQNRLQQSLYYRLMVIWMPEWLSASWTYNTGITSGTELFWTSSNLISAPVNYKLGNTILYDKVFNLSTKTNNGAAPYYQQQFKRVKVKINKKLTYEPGTNFFTKKQLFVVLIPLSIDAGITPGVSSVGATDIHCLTSYQDA